jgi:polyhydroxyalkanoate synthesis regulator phasin
MSDLISRALLCGLGLASLTKEAIQKTAKDLIDQSELSEEEGRKLVKDLHRRATEAQKAIDQKIEAAVHRALKTLDLPAVRGAAKRAKAAVKRASKTHARGRAHRAAKQ